MNYSTPVQNNMGLNQGQQEAYHAFLEFMISDRKEFSISGPGGVGKTHLMRSLIDDGIPQYQEMCKLLGIEYKFDNLAVTATTNQAAAVLAAATGQDAQTIHAFLGLKVQNDFKTGETKLSKRKGVGVHEDTLVFIDEGSMIDSPLYTHVHQGLTQSKIVYIGDHCQLPPTKERLSPIYRNGIETVHLTEPMRNANQPALMAVCAQLRETVETGEFKPIQVVPGVIDLLDPQQMQTELDILAANPDMSARILAYTNEQVQLYNDHIRSVRGLPDQITIGETLINNRAIHLPDRMLPTDHQITITDLAPTSKIKRLDDQIELEVIDATFELGNRPYTVEVPIDRDHFADVCKHFGRTKNWASLYGLTDHIPDLRPRDATTVHKAQGASFDMVYIDLANISTCHNPTLAARLLYVAFTRARNRIVLYGDLANKYGGLIR